MIPTKWIDALLQRHGIESPNGRPLYQYRITDQEFEELTRLLKLSAPFGINNITKMVSWDAAFVMYGSEWWRRYYTGQWGWDGVFGSIGLDHNELPTVQRNTLIETGLHRWRRDVRVVGERRAYLGTVATEGGLPLNQLQDSGGWLRSVLQYTLSKHLAKGINIEVLVDSYEDLIPRSYRSVALGQILADIAQTVVTLRQDHDLKDKEEPLVWLDANLPSWRELFPLPMDDSQAKSLLSDLIDTASKTKMDDSAKNPFEVERVLVRAETASADLVAQIDVPEFVFLDAIGFNTSEGNIPSRINLEVYEPGGEVWPLCEGFVTTYKAQQALKLPGKPLRLTGTSAIKELRLRFKHVGECLLDVEIIGGVSLDPDLPWLFRDVEGKWILYGTASQSIKDEKAMVYIPTNCSFTKDGDETEVVRCGDLFDGELLKLSGVMHCRYDDAKYKLSAGLEESVVKFELKGDMCRYPSLPKEIYLGHPDLVETNVISGIVSRLPGAELLAKKIGVEEAWQSIAQVGPGYYEVRRTDPDGNIQLRKRIGILDKDFKVDIKPDRREVKSGLISIYGAPGMDVVGIREDNVRYEVSGEENRRDITVRANDEPPLSVDVSLSSHGHRKAISMTFPYPSHGALLFDGLGAPVSLSNSQSLSNLKGYRLKLFDDKYHKGQKVNLLFTLVDFDVSNSDVRDIYLKKQLPLLGEMTEFSPYDWHQYINSLISVSTSIDSKVQISMSLGGQEVFELSIRRYENKLAKTGNGLVEFDSDTFQSISIDQLDGTQVSVMNLAQPEQSFDDLPAHSSQGAHTGTWDFNPESRQDGPWIIYPSPKSSVQFRPKLWNIGRSDPEEDIHTLTKAMLIDERDKRAEKIKSVMGEMADGPDHRSWDYLVNLWEKTRHLPVTTFDIWKFSVSEPSFLASLFIFIREKNGIVEALEKEMPVIWELVRVEDWEKSLNRYRSSISKKLDDDTLVDELLSKKIESIKLLSSSMLSIGMILRDRLLGERCQELDTLKSSPIDAFLSPQIKEEHQNLLRRQAESNWPELMSDYIYHQVQDFPSTYGSLIRTNHHHQTAVTFLPWIMAWRSLSKDHVLWPSEPAEVFKVQQLKQFDEDWFSAAFQYLSGWLSQQKMESL